MRWPKLPNKDLRSAILWMFGGVLFVSWLYGSWHAFTRHGLTTALTGFLIPPYGIYLAGEAEHGHPQASKVDLTTPHGQQIAIAAMNNNCLANNEHRQRSGLAERQYREFCRCVAYSTVEILQQPRPDNIDSDSQAYKQKIARGEQSCWSTAKYIPE